MTLPAGIIKLTYPDGSWRTHNGSIFAGVAPKHLGPYTEDGLTVDMHWWNSLARKRATPITAVRSPDQIVTAKQMFPYGDTGCTILPVGTFTFKGPMDWAGMTQYMPSGGERPEIGLITDPSALFMLGGSPQSMLAWAQANDSWPIHFIDETTGRSIDLLKYPKANANDNASLGQPWLPKGEPDPKAPAYTTWGDGFTPQQAHYTEMTYVAYLATLDIGFLENVQSNATFGVVADGWISGQRNIATIYGELRGIAWAFRNLFMAHVATLDAEARGILPATCHPSSYWKQVLDNQLAYYSQFMVDPANQVFRLVSGVGTFAPWQCDYMLMTLAFGVLTGHSDWTPLYLWALGNAIARTNNTPWQSGGYPPGYGGAYWMDAKPTWYESFLAMSPAPPLNSPPPSQATIDALKLDPLNGGRAMNNNESMMTTRTVLITADYLEKLGLVNVRGMYPELDNCIKICTTMTKNYGAVNARASIILTRGTPMGKPFTVQVGSSIELPITWDAAGQPAQQPTEIVVAAAPTGLVSLTLAADKSKVTVTGVAVGAPLVTVTGKAGTTVLQEASQGTVVAAPLPLATAIHINA